MYERVSSALLVRQMHKPDAFYFFISELFQREQSTVPFNNYIVLVDGNRIIEPEQFDALFDLRDLFDWVLFCIPRVGD